MLKFLIDEDLPRSTTALLRNRGYEVFDARDCGLKAECDEEVFKFALNKRAVLITGDLGFGNILKFPLGGHSGIIIVHFPNEISTKEMNHQIKLALDNLSEDDFKGNLIILEPGRIRIRRK